MKSFSRNTPGGAFRRCRGGNIAGREGGSAARHGQSGLRLRSPVVLRIVKSAKGVAQNSKTRFAQTDEFWATTHICQS